MTGHAPFPPSMKLMGVGTQFQQELGEMLAETWLFGELEWHEIEVLAKHVQAYEAEGDTVLFREGEAGTFMCVIIEGSVAIFKEDRRCQDKCVALVGHGRSLGEMAIIDGEPRSATCITAVPTKLVVLTKDHFGRIMEKHPALGLHVTMKVARLLSQRLRKTSGLLVDYLQQD